MIKVSQRLKCYYICPAAILTEHEGDQNKGSDLRIVDYRHCKLRTAFFI